MNRINTLLVFILLGACCPYAFSSQKMDVAERSFGDALTKRIDSIYKTLYYDDFAGALAALNMVEQKASDSALWEVQLSALLNMHYCAQYHGVVDTMVYYLEAARTLFNEKSNAVPIHVRNKLEQKLLYANGNAAYTFGEYERAITEFERILTFDSLKPVYVYKCLSYIGHAYANLDNYPQSIDYHIQALEQLPGDEKYHYYRGVSFSYLGISCKKMYELKQDTTLLRKALKHYLVSLSYFTRSTSKNKTGPIGCYTLLSEAYGILGKPDSSAYFLTQAQLIDPEHTETLRFWGMHYHRLGKYDKARESFLKSNETISKTKGPQHFLKGRNLMQVGKQYEAEGRWEEAIRSYQQAFQYLTMGNQALTDVFTNPNTDNVVSYRDFFECLRLKAGALLRWARASSTSPEDRVLRLSKSIETYALVIKLIDEQRTKYVSTKYRQLIGAKALSIYENAISACYDAIRSGLDSARYTSLAFHFFEKNKNRQLRDALRLHQEIQYAGIPQSLLEKEAELKRKLRYSNRLLFQQKQKTGEKKDLEKIQSLQEEVFALSNKWEQFDRQLSTEYPAYHQLKNGEPIMDLIDLQSRLGEQTLLLEYFYGDEEAFVFAIRNEDVTFEKLLPVDTLDKLLTKSLRSARKPLPGQLPSETLFTDLHALKEGLFPKEVAIPPGINKLLVVPDGPLGYLPFEMLITSLSASPRFLVEDFNIHYAYSSYLVEKKVKPKTPDMKYLGFAPSYPQYPVNTSNRASDTRSLGVLAHNREEVERAQAYFSGVAFLDSASTEDQFKSHAKSAGILHFSMHAWINDERPELSRLIFYQPKRKAGATELDGNLYLYELYNESLQAQLAVLSACNTGYGQLSRGEGISSLGRAFRYAGCNSIVMNLWEANDKHAQFLMNRFFFHLKEGLGKDEALRQAKLDFLNEPSHKYFKHPFYWASLILIGEPAGLSLQKDYTLIIMVLLLILIVAVLSYRYYRRSLIKE